MRNIYVRSEFFSSFCRSAQTSSARLKIIFMACLYNYLWLPPPWNPTYACIACLTLKPKYGCSILKARMMSLAHLKGLLEICQPHKKSQLFMEWLTLNIFMARLLSSLLMSLIICSLLTLKPSIFMGWPIFLAHSKGLIKTFQLD